MNSKQFLLSTLKELQTTIDAVEPNIAVRKLGICAFIVTVFDRDFIPEMRETFEMRNGALNKFETIYVAWPKYSWRDCYPVPHPTMDACDAFYETEDMFDGETEYGRNRRELLVHAIDVLTKEEDAKATS